MLPNVAKFNSYPQNCLSLNIFTSNVVYDELQPVVVFIGGSDLKEDQEVRPTSSAAKKHKVVFVDVSYRLGALGFLSLKSLALRSHPNYSGNYGLGDVITALEWIKLNIQHFGGHPHKVRQPTNKSDNVLEYVVNHCTAFFTKVTLLGRGFGADVVLALTTAPKAKGLFHQVWATNGAGAFANNTLKQVNSENKVSQGIGFSNDTPK